MAGTGFLSESVPLPAEWSRYRVVEADEVDVEAPGEAARRPLHRAYRLFVTFS